VEAEVIKEDNVFPMIPAGAPLRDMIIERPKQKMAKPKGAPSHVRLADHRDATSVVDSVAERTVAHDLDPGAQQAGRCWSGSRWSSRGVGTTSRAWS